MWDEPLSCCENAPFTQGRMYSLPTWFSEGMAVAFSGQVLSWKADAVAENGKLHPGYQEDNGPYLLDGEYGRAVAIVRDSLEYGFDEALLRHTRQPVLTPVNLREELLSFVTA